MAYFGGTDTYKPGKTIREYAYQNKFVTSDGRTFSNLNKAKNHQEKNC